MKIVSHPCALRLIRRPVVLAVGFFDGLHRGHQAVINRTVRKARSVNGEAWVLTFRTHPMKVVAPPLAPALLMSTRHKLKWLRALGVDGCLVMPFTKKLAGLDPAAFVKQLRTCVPTLSEVLVGRNWRFGKGGSGTPRIFAKFARERGFRVRVVPPFLRKGQPVSSTRIRSHVLRGDLEEAAALLGRPFSVLGRVVRGRGVGRTLGYPTANLRTQSDILPPCGVYAVHALLGKKLLDGVLNYGIRPTFGSAATATPLMELHLFQFRKSLYGKEIEVFFAGRLRGERRFSSLADLQRQIARDVRSATRRMAAKNVKETLYTFCGSHYSPAQKTTKQTRESTGNRLPV